MKERPILFSGPMVRAILSGTKTQTRRIVRLPGGAPWRLGHVDEDGASFSRADRMVRGREVVTECWELPCPHGVVGERLWVRETFRQAPGSMSVHYRADPDEISGGPWRSPYHMFRWQSRLMLEISDVRVQRLQEIGEEDAKAEGVAADTEPCDHVRRSCASIGCLGPGYRAAFADLWALINGKRATWVSNPWVWALTFRRLT